MPAAPTPVLARAKDAQAVLGISRATLYRWENEGFIKLYRRGSMTFFKPQEVVAAIEAAGGQLGD